MSSLVGKVVANAAYVLPENVGTLPAGYAELISKSQGICNEALTTFNVIKVSPKTEQVSFLEYDDLIQTPFPVLRQSISVNLVSETVTRRSYRTHDNPPIFHRKELLFGDAHPDYETFSLLTRTLEGFGLFGETARIGRQQEWDELLASVGIELDGHRVIRSIDVSSDVSVDRHRTALVRSSLSSPIQTALKFNLLTPEHSVFDYGCGRGDDLALLTADGFDAVGWDPYYAPDGERRASHLVNLGYVLNVIEDPLERVSVLKDAYGYAQDVMVVAALIDGQKSRSQARRYRDGIITKRGTFQKFFTQMELRELIETSLQTEAVSVGPGLFFVIRDELEREAFLRIRQIRTPRVVLPRISARAKRLVELSTQEDLELANEYWVLACDRGRLPRSSELPKTISEWSIGKFGSHKRASAWLTDHFGSEMLEHAIRVKRGQLLCYLALALFRRKKLRSLMTAELRREIKQQFGSLKLVEEEAFQTLRNMADVEMLANNCMEACEQGGAQIDGKGRLIVHAERVSELPPSLQVVIGVAEWLGGDLSSVDVVSVRVENVAVTFHRYRNFSNEPFPVLEARLRVYLAKQSVRYLPELENEPLRMLVGKSDILTSEDEVQKTLDKAIKSAAANIYVTHHVDVSTLVQLIGQTGRTWEGIELRMYLESLPNEKFDLTKLENRILDNAVLPSLDDPCGRFLNYRDFIECGETQQRTGILNLPKRPESYGAINALATMVLDLVIEEYGMIKLTYGFSSPELSRVIMARIAPKIDQHSACELSRQSMPICSRQGAAVDFIVEDESMLEVAQWIAKHCEFDRLYYYGDDRPVHVSAGPENNGAIVLMKLRKDGRIGPHKISPEEFLELENT
jgi:DNA phosphorothioation-associated putative methyltransferase